MPRIVTTRCDARRRPEATRGGHFAALEEPDALVEDIRRFFRTIRGETAG